MANPSPSAKEKLERMDRPFTAFVALASAILFFGDSFLSPDDYQLAFAVLALAFVGFWLYGAAHMPGAINEQLNKSHHPDEDVRALQDGEISISEYAERKVAKQRKSEDATQQQSDER